jgi:Zn-dependent peptidase ImmA (M78 family)/DNA-binding XRE family transcriptional regulator
MKREELLAVRSLFDGRRLEQARELQGILKSELAEQVHLSAAAIGQFESGVSRPNTGTIAQLSMALGVPPGFFSVGRPQVDLAEDNVHFRSLRSTSKRDRTQARAQVRLLAEIVGVLSRRVRLPAVDLPEYFQEASPEAVAREIRELWELGEGPVGDMVRLLERHGVIVLRLDATSDDLDAFSCWISADRPYVILTNNKRKADRSRFDAAHELFHLIAHHDASPGDKALEEAAHRFAASFLLPEPAMRKELPQRVDWRRLGELKLRWGVSMAALLFRARSLGLVSEDAYRRGMMDMSRRNWRQNEPVDLGEPEQPQVLRRAIELVAKARNYTIEDLAAEVALPASALAPFRLTLDSPELPELLLP